MEVDEAILILFFYIISVPINETDTPYTGVSHD